MIYDQQSITDQHSGRGSALTIPLLRPVSGGGYIEFRFLSQFQLFYCDSSHCSLCTLSANDSSCAALSISWNDVEVSSMTSVSVARSSANLLVRVAEPRRAAVLSYSLRLTENMVPHQVATDPPYISDFSTVEGFSRGKHTYFVGSAFQPYEPFINANLQDENRTIAKITRICNFDATPELESRMDVAIQCGTDGVNQRVEASSYDPYQDQLTVIVASTTSSPTKRAICVLSMADVEERFERDWALCQKSTLRDGAVSCEVATTETVLDDQCYIFTRRADAFRMQICTRFGQDAYHVYENCNLHRYAESSYRYSCLETDLDHIFSLIPDQRHGAYFIGGYAKGLTIILRIPMSNAQHHFNSPTLWRRSTFPVTRFPIGMNDSGEAIFILNSSVVTLTPISCGGLYSTCDDLKRGGWFDPMSCVWCSDDQRQFVTSASDKLCFQPLVGVCPPIVDHANRNDNHSEWEVYGSNFDILENIKIYVCDQLCTINKLMSTSSRLSCILLDDSVHDTSCPIRVVGRLANYDDFTLYVKKTTHSVALMTDHLSRAKSSRTWKIALAIIVVVLILIVLGIIIYLARNRMRFSNVEPMPGFEELSTTKSRIFVTSKPEKSNPLILLSAGNSSKNEACLMDYLSPYEDMFKSIDDRLKIDVSLLHFETEIGRGHFGIVSRATYTPTNGTTKKVACKFLKESVAGVGDFILEGLTMGRFNHPHLMQLLGIAFADGRIPIIVTDYMENGDLRSYLRDISKVITIRKLLRFACQIAEGMKHLHLCRSVHCDLAARNCMLDADLNIKIGDFGLCRRVNDESESYKPSHKHRDVPFPWMAPEAIRSETFTFQNDVWAYGVVLWELTTRGLTPYAGKNGIEILEFLRDNNRLEMPEYCPTQMYDEIMLPCWHADPQQRPTFVDLVTLVNNLITCMESSQLNRLSCNYEKLSTVHVDSTSIQSNGFEHFI
ncbi:hypothetical protein KIN20_035532 [Parelaphostrongylus tenuis]|uniref:Protein kinase domain-containing protein n=1 Tax=Parelaphostrongylus tenuis TaxID=148309 RepID=A0AAD5RBV0_PARTN|nr:hypothetical protein KIN20_035532 [Parelaphostrongylus tenuis]